MDNVRPWGGGGVGTAGKLGKTGRSQETLGWILRWKMQVASSFASNLLRPLDMLETDAHFY